MVHPNDQKNTYIQYSVIFTSQYKTINIYTSTFIIDQVPIAYLDLDIRINWQIFIVFTKSWYRTRVLFHQSNNFNSVLDINSISCTTSKTIWLVLSFSSLSCKYWKIIKIGIHFVATVGLRGRKFSRQVWHEVSSQANSYCGLLINSLVTSIYHLSIYVHIAMDEGLNCVVVSVF